MADEGEGATHAGFLPPEPPGPEPDLGRRGAAAAPPPESPRQDFAPPAEHEAHGAARQDYPPAAQQLGWNAPSAGGSPGQVRPPAYPGAPLDLGNGQAVAGLSLSIASIGLLVLSLGASTIVSIACSALGIHYSRKGRARVDRDETTQHRGVAQAGFVTGIVALVLSVLCTIIWVLFVILLATDEDFRQDLKDELDDGDGGDPPRGFETSLQLVATTLRLLAVLLR